MGIDLANELGDQALRIALATRVAADAWSTIVADVIEALEYEA